MDKRFINGLANQAMTEFENIKKLREEFISCGAPKKHIETLQGSMKAFLNIYLRLTEKKMDE